MLGGGGGGGGVCVFLTGILYGNNGVALCAKNRSMIT